VHVFAAEESAGKSGGYRWAEDASEGIAGGAANGAAALNGPASPLIINNWIVENSATEGAGVFCGACSAVLANNIARGNAANNRGGAVFFSDNCTATAVNCTLVGNIAGVSGGGVYSESDSVAVINSILWGNGNDLDGCSATYSLIGNAAGHDEGTGNVHGDPLFLDAIRGDLRLRPASPCIDAGDNGAPELPAEDLKGGHRVLYGGKSQTVDMGALEYDTCPPELAGDPADVRLKWSSVAARTYSVYYSADLVSWQVAEANVVSEGNTVTTWLDREVLPLVRQRFYRIMEER
jgi:hypothetical protein